MIFQEFIWRDIAFSSFILPRELRKELKEPFGELVISNKDSSEKKVAAIVEQTTAERFLIVVGDVSTETLVAIGCVPDISIVDSKTLREDREIVRIPGAKEVYTRSPAGEISQDAWETIKKTIKEATRDKIPIVIYVDGEEDLLTIPATLEAPLGAFVVYGQPGEGLVLVRVSKDTKKKCNQLLSKFEEKTSLKS